MRYKVYKDTRLESCGTLRARNAEDATNRAAALWGSQPDRYYVEAQGAVGGEVFAVFACLAVVAVGWWAVSDLAG